MFKEKNVASLYFSFSFGEWGPVLMGTGSRNFIGSTDFPFERSATDLKKNSYMFFWRLAPLTVRVLGAVASGERAWDPHICHEAFHDRKNGGRALLAHALRPL